MKLNLTVLFLTLALTSWAQTTTSTPEQKSVPADNKMACACCDKMAATEEKTSENKTTDQKEMHACMHRSAAENDEKAAVSCSGKDNAGCCAGKDGKSCAKTDQAASSCCEGMKTGEGKEMSCCSDKDGKKMSHDCCGGNQCGKHDHAAGN